MVVCDVQGRRVRTLHLGALPAGATRVDWDGRTDRGAAAAPGVYYGVARVRGERAAVRVVLVK